MLLHIRGIYWYNVNLADNSLKGPRKIFEALGQNTYQGCIDFNVVSEHVNPVRALLIITYFKFNNLIKFTKYFHGFSAADNYDSYLQVFWKLAI